MINNVVSSNSIQRYDILSTLITTADYLKMNNYSNAQCGNLQYRSFILTNFTLINSTSLNLTSNYSNDGAACDGEVELACELRNLTSIQWTYNDKLPFTHTFYHSPYDIFPLSLVYTFPRIIRALLYCVTEGSLHGMNCTSGLL